MDDTFISSLSPENWPFDLSFLPQPAYMVGGAVRDALLGRTREYLDLDFIVPSVAVKVARNIAKHYKAGFVLLDAERQIARVVFPHATADFAQLEGDNLDTDLHRRDFTVNAIAYNPHTEEIIDPLGGCIDLQQGILKMVHPKNLSDDPLRLMRGYRQAAQLGFRIESATQQTIRNLAERITTVATERIRVELNYLLLNAKGTPWLTSAWSDGVLKHILKNANQQSFVKLAAVDSAAALLGKTWPQLEKELNNYLRDTIKTTLLAIAKLACLVNQEPAQAETQMLQLSYSRIETRAVTTTLKLFPQLNNPEMILREQYLFFKEAGFVFPATALLAIAGGTMVGEIAPFITRYLNPDDPVAHPTTLVSGKDLIIALSIPTSPVIGKLLTEIAVAQLESRIQTKEEAIELARELLSSPSSEMILDFRF